MTNKELKKITSHLSEETLVLVSSFNYDYTVLNPNVAENFFLVKEESALYYNHNEGNPVKLDQIRSLPDEERLFIDIGTGIHFRPVSKVLILSDKIILFP